MLPSENWAPLYRRILKSNEWVGQKATTKVVLVWIILRVRHTDNGSTPAGSVDCVLPDICNECELTTNTVRTALAALEESGFITCSRLRNGTRITILGASRWLRNVKPADDANESWMLRAKAQNVTDENATFDTPSLQEGKEDLSASQRALFPQHDKNLSIAARGVGLDGYKESIALFFDLFTAAYGAKPAWRGAGDGAQMKRLLASHGSDEVQRRMRMLFEAPPSWLRPPYTFGTFVRHFDALVIAPAGPTTKGARQGGLSPAQILQQATRMAGDS